MSKKTANDTTLQSTKQMLDELDALMEQMLSLPVNDPDETAAFPKDVVKPHALTASVTMLEAPANPPSTPLAKGGGVEPMLHPTLNAPHMALIPPPFPPFQGGAAPMPAPLTNDALPASLLPQMEPLLAEVPESETAISTLWLYQPLVWMNQWFDAGTMKFGGLGAWMRTQASRTVLGLAGITLLTVSVGWCLKDWLGWKW